MNIILSPEQEQNYEKLLNETRQKVQVGLEQLERGEKIAHIEHQSSIILISQEQCSEMHCLDEQLYPVKCLEWIL